jgi:hypothetical protein
MSVLMQVLSVKKPDRFSQPVGFLYVHFLNLVHDICQ